MSDDNYDPPRLFSRRSDRTWTTLLERVGGIEDFRTWGDDPHWYYQWAIVLA
jgi:hypothetical protein